MRGTRAPAEVQILYISCSFSENLIKSYVGAPWRVGAPRQGNPGSATVYMCNLSFSVPYVSTMFTLSIWKGLETNFIIHLNPALRLRALRKFGSPFEIPWVFFVYFMRCWRVRGVHEKMFQMTLIHWAMKMSVME